MDYNRLIQFKTIAEYENVSKAAEVLYISQPALSKSLSSLEKELGCELFVRNGKRLKLNSNGEKLLNYTRQIEKLFDEIEFEFSQKNNQEKVLNIGGTGNYFSFVLSGYFKDGMQPIKISSMNSISAIQSLLSEETDVIISDDMFINASSYSNVKRVAVFDEQLLLSIPKWDPLADRKSISINEISKHKIIRLIGDAELNNWISQILKINKVSIDWSMEIDQQTLNLFSNDMSGSESPYYFISSSSFLDPGSRKEYTENRALLRVKGDYTDRMIYVWYLERNKDKISNFLESLKNIYNPA